jgi:hypothetical protein
MGGSGGDTSDVRTVSSPYGCLYCSRSHTPGAFTECTPLEEWSRVRPALRSRSSLRETDSFTVLVRCTLACYTQLVGTCSLMATWMRCLQTASKDARHPLHRHACVPTTDSHVRSTGHLRATTPCVPAACTLACKARPERDTVYALVALTPPKKRL